VNDVLYSIIAVTDEVMESDLPDMLQFAKDPGSDGKTNKTGYETSREGLDMWLNRSNVSSDEMFQTGLLRQALSIG
jgi:hypothetical protein